MPMRWRRSASASARMGTPSIDHARARAGVVEAQQQLEHRALAGAAGADQGHRFAGRDGSEKSAQRRLRGATGSET
jgi:hypothetical protein